jgi:hypothetical protein
MNGSQTVVLTTLLSLVVFLLAGPNAQKDVLGRLGKLKRR